MKKIDCFIPFSTKEVVKNNISRLRENPAVGNIFVLGSQKDNPQLADCKYIQCPELTSTSAIKKIAQAAENDNTLIFTDTGELVPGYLAPERFIRIAEDSRAGMVYSDSYIETDGVRSHLPVIDYQEGSVRDDFNFGAVLFFNTSVLQLAAAEMKKNFKAAGLYDLRLRVSRIAPIFHINETLYTVISTKAEDEGESHFNYVDPKNRASQIEMEAVCTAHLKAIGAFLKPRFKDVNFNTEEFATEASVIIPVRNRARTIRDAIKSVLSQKTTFPFNLIIVDNHSTDGTSEIIEEFSNDSRLIHIIPSRSDLGIGGCWNLGVHHEACGRFAVQLDSDDVYSGEDTLQKMVNAFYEQNCAMVVGTYMLTDIDMNPIPPGIIDHKEWTPENGRNNALRINGLGAPRAFYTPILRLIGVPNTSYGEDYALGLAFSREYQIGRVYDTVYYCRRWEDNSDHALDVIKTNANNLYKDRLRTLEIQARKSINIK